MTQGVLDVSVIIPAYNAETVLARAVGSVLAQTFPPREIVVVADETTDGTADVARGFGDPVRFYHQTNCGVAAARNLAIEKAGGEWIAFLDADDWWEPMRLARQVEILERHPELQWVSGRYTAIWPGGKRLVRPVDVAYEALLVDGCYFENFFEAAVAGVNCHTSTLLIRRSVILDVGLFDVDLTCGEDTDLCYRIADRFPAIGYVNRPVSVYDRSSGEGSLIRNESVQLTNGMAVLARHVLPLVPCDWKAAGPKERFFRNVIDVALRFAILRGERENLRCLLSVYGDFLSPGMRFLGRVAGVVPPTVLVVLGRWYTRTIGSRRPRT